MQLMLSAAKPNVRSALGFNFARPNLRQLASTATRTPLGQLLNLAIVRLTHGVNSSAARHII